MPLVPARNKTAIRKNALEMMASGRASDQSWAVARTNAERHPRARGDLVPEKAMGRKIKRDAFLYLDPKPPNERFAQCSTCIEWISGKNRCLLHRKQDEIDGDDFCGVYVHGTPMKDGEPLGLLTPEQSGLVDRQVRCENCSFFDDIDEPRAHCDLYTQLNRILPHVFALDRYVDWHGCCNAQEPGKRDPEVFGPHGPIGESGEQKMERATGGLVPHPATGGIPSRGLGPGGTMAAGVDLRQGAHSFYHPGGFIESGVAGRTDALPLAVPADSHVIPADVVSGLGEGNSLNGAHLLDQIFHAGPWGIKAIRSRPTRGAMSLARGGHGDPVTEILAAGGEYVVRPEAIARYGSAARRRDPKRHGRKSDMAAGHDAVDDFILRARRHVIATTRKLPGPVKG